MSSQYSKGFTLIELLVVISIVGLLSSVVLASLTSARTKGFDAAIKGDLAGVRVQAEVYNELNGAYAGTAPADTFIGGCRSTPSGLGSNLFADPNIINAMTDANTKSGGGLIAGNTLSKTGCAASPTSYAASVGLRNTASRSWCVDSSGIARQLNVGAGSAIVGDGSIGDPYRCQ